MEGFKQVLFRTVSRRWLLTADNQLKWTWLAPRGRAFSHLLPLRYSWRQTATVTSSLAARYPFGSSTRRRTEVAEADWKVEAYENGTPDLSSLEEFHAHMRAAADLRQVQLCVELFEELSERSKFEPNEKTFRILIYAFANSEDDQNAFDCLSEAISRGLPVDAQSFMLVIQALSHRALLQPSLFLAPDIYGEDKDLQDVVEYFLEAGEEKKQQEEEDAQSLEDYFQKDDEEGQAQSLAKDACCLLQEMTTKYQLEADAFTYSLVASACSHSLQPFLTTAVFAMMKSKGIYPEQKHYAELFYAYEALGKTAQALGVLESMVELGYGIDSVVLYEKGIACYVSVKQMEAAHSLFREMKRGGFQPTLKSFDLLISGYCSANRVEDALQVAG